MRALILNGSPRPHGDTAALLAALCEDLSGPIDTFDAYRRLFSPCIDCRRCWTQPGCVFDDPSSA